MVDCAVNPPRLFPSVVLALSPGFLLPPFSSAGLRAATAGATPVVDRSPGPDCFLCLPEKAAVIAGAAATHVVMLSLLPPPLTLKTLSEVGVKSATDVGEAVLALLSAAAATEPIILTPLPTLLLLPFPLRL